MIKSIPMQVVVTDKEFIDKLTELPAVQKHLLRGAKPEWYCFAHNALALKNTNCGASFHTASCCSVVIGVSLYSARLCYNTGCRSIHIFEGTRAYSKAGLQGPTVLAKFFKKSENTLPLPECLDALKVEYKPI